MLEESINQTIFKYMDEFKRHLLTQLSELKNGATSPTEFENMENMQKFICGYKTLCISIDPKNLQRTSKSHLKKNAINLKKCWAKLESGCQCNRKHYSTNNFCKDHMNNTSFGCITDTEKQTTANKNEKKIILPLEIQDINGILYFKDDDQNIYDTESILSQQLRPLIIGNVNTFEIKKG